MKMIYRKLEIQFYPVCLIVRSKKALTFRKLAIPLVASYLQN